MKRILIADDHAIFRKGLKETLQEELGDLRFGEADNGIQVMELVRRQAWELVLLDISMEGRDGLAVLEDIQLERPGLPVLILSMHPEAQFASRALKLGAAGYLTKQTVPEELIAAVNKVLGGGRYVSATLGELLAAEIQGSSDKAPHDLLSNRELQVLRLIATGKSLKEIGAQLCISVKTVSTYHTRLLEKMGMKSDVELTRYALQNKLVS